MIPNRESGAEQPNQRLAPLTARWSEGRQTNTDWLAASPLKAGVILLGGSSLADFRIRFAQSQLRHDLTPSYWSLCGLLSADGRIQTAPIATDDISGVPATNAVRLTSIDDFDDPHQWPNIAVIEFVAEPGSLDAFVAAASRRAVIDLPSLVVSWLAYAWAAGGSSNPLLRGEGLPSAAFVETVYSLAGIELTPGLSSAASCPEAIWQAAKWWHEYYAEGSALRAPEMQTAGPYGFYRIGQPAAAIQDRLGHTAPAR